MQRSPSQRQQDVSSGVHHNRPPAPPPLPWDTPLSSISKKKKTPYVIQRDYKVLEREKRVTTILNNDRFRAELESILQGQRDGSGQPKKTNLQKLQDNSPPKTTRDSRIPGAHGSVGEAVIPINDLRGVSASKYTVAERQARCKLAAVYRLVELFGWSQLIYNHITACCPSGKNTILINAFGLMYHEVTASSLVTVDLTGNIVDPGSTQLGINQPGFSLHSVIHAARSDVKCVVHVHTNAGVAISSMSCGILPISEEALSVGGISYHDHCSSGEQRERIARDLGPTNMVLVLRNHGLVAMGRSIEEAFYITEKLVKACEIQVALMSVGIANIIQSPGRVWSQPCLGGVGGVTTFTTFGSISREWGPGELEFEALMRMLDNKGYNTGYRYKGLSLLEPDSGKSGSWNRKQENGGKEASHEKASQPLDLDLSDSSDPTRPGDCWDFLDQRKVERTEPVIKPKHKAGTKRHKGAMRSPTAQRAHSEAADNHPPSPNRGPLRNLANTVDNNLSPLERAELMAGRVAQSTGEAVQRLATDSSLRQTNQRPAASNADASPQSNTYDNGNRYFSLSHIHKPAQLDNPSYLSPLQMAQYTAEHVAESTGQAVRKLTLDFTSKTDHLQDGDLETSSEPSLLNSRTHGHSRRRTNNGDVRLSSSLTHLYKQTHHPNGHTAYDSDHSDLRSSPREIQKDLSSVHRPADISYPDGFSPLQRVTHTAERVAGSTGVAVYKLSGSLTSQ